MSRKASTNETESPSNHDAGRVDESGPTPEAPWRPTLHDARAVRLATTIVLGGLGVLAVLFLISLLPGIDAAGRTFAALGSAVLGVALSVTVGYLALVLPRYVRTAFALPRDVRDPSSSALTWALALASILLLHRGFAPLYGMLDGPTLLYDGGFFLLAIGPVVLVARALWRLIDPAATLLSRELAGSQ